MRPIANALLIAALTLVGCTATPQRAADAVREDRFDPKDYSGTGVEGAVPTSLAAPMAAPGTPTITSITSAGAMCG